MEKLISCAVTCRGGKLMEQKQSNKIYQKSVMKLSRTSKVYRHKNYGHFQNLQA